MAKSNWNTENIPDQKGRVVIVTGATSGLGKEAARVLAGKNASVIMAVRNVTKGEGVADGIRQEFPAADVTVRDLDLSSLSSVESFAEGINKDYDRLDILINNAGVMMCPYSKTQDGFEIQMGTNHLGHFALTGQLMPLLEKTDGSRIVATSSAAHNMGNIDFSDINWERRKYNTQKAYGDSKIANLYFTYELARRMNGNGESPLVTAAHPGWTGTDLQRHSGFIRFLNNFLAQGTDIGTLPTLMAAIDPDAQPGDYYGPSRFFEMRGKPVKVESNKRSHNTEAAQRLWEMSEQMTGVSY
jgi:NAD(P)-dependent dehydrogenase (short-subunit alcohol dehydrogenase family)